MPDRVASSSEVAAALRISAATVQWHARKGRIPFDSTPGGHRRFDIAEVQLSLGDNADDVVTELDRPRPTGVGRGVPAPTSANANLIRGLRAARPEPRPSPVTSEASHQSALGTLVSKARHVKLATVSS